ncbi:MAG TPA: circularly permuted type 2 ATP-grasp protein, partial [Chthoniobacteraceae bacterium]
MLTPGPYTATYFEHAYIARYLGYPLVEGSDLTVRDRRLYIKTIEGLHRVDVLIRRVDDTYCDPLELRSDSFLGVPGLLDAARAGNVAISNALGSGAVEGPAWLAFLPALARRLLDEELHIPNVATWWCGQSVERSYALEHLDSLVVKMAFSTGKEDPVFCRGLARGELDGLIARIRARPCDFVAQQRVPLSTAPVWNGERLEPRPLILRCFVAANAEGFVVMAGGLTRLSATPDSPVVSSRFGGGSKDTWALTNEPVEEITLLDRRGAPASTPPTSGIISSRTLDNLFWLGRYTERLEDTVRLFRVVLARLVSEGTADEAEELTAMSRCLVALDRLPGRFTGHASGRELTAALSRLVFEKVRPGSVAEMVKRVSILTARLRVRFSGDTWRILHKLQTEFPAEAPMGGAAAILECLHRLVFQLAALSGVETENMTRGTQWLFLDLGRRIERANNVVEVIKAIVVSDPDAHHSLPPLLEYCDSTMTYRRRYFSQPEFSSTLD